MTKIRIHTESVRGAGRRFIAKSNHLAEIGQALQGAIGSLDTWAWDGVSRARAEPLLGRVRPESATVAEELERLGHMLIHVADVFEHEDNTAAGNLAGMPWVDWDTIGGGSILDIIGDLKPWWPFPGRPPWDLRRPIPWPPPYWPWIPILPVLPLLPPWFRPPQPPPKPGLIPAPISPPQPPPEPLPNPNVVLPPKGVGSDKRPWSYVNAPIKSDESNRSADMYNRVLDQFKVASNPRYRANQQGKKETYCNIFVWDATRAMGAEIPHWVDKKGRPVPQGKGRELSANGAIRWLEKHGPRAGWHAVSADEAQALASQGKPVVATYKNPSGIGHIAMVRPGKGPAIAQAGAKNFNKGTVKDGFGNRRVVYYAHD